MIFISVRPFVSLLFQAWSWNYIEIYKIVLASHFLLKIWYLSLDKNNVVILIYLSDHQSFIGMLQELEEVRVLELIPNWAYVPTSTRFRLPTYTTTRCDLYYSQQNFYWMFTMADFII